MILQLDLLNVWYYVFFIALMNHKCLVLRLKSSLLKFHVDAMTCLAVTDDTIATFFPVMIYRWIWSDWYSIRNMTDTTSGVETGYSSGTPELVTDCGGARTSQILVFCSVSCGPYAFPFSFCHCILCLSSVRILVTTDWPMKPPQLGMCLRILITHIYTFRDMNSSQWCYVCGQSIRCVEVSIVLFLVYSTGDILSIRTANNICTFTLTFYLNTLNRANDILPEYSTKIGNIIEISL